jgi:hypothetical protein
MRVLDFYYRNILLNQQRQSEMGRWGARLGRGPNKDQASCLIKKQRRFLKDFQQGNDQFTRWR